MNWTGTHYLLQCRSTSGVITYYNEVVELWKVADGQWCCWFKREWIDCDNPYELFVGTDLNMKSLNDKQVDFYKAIL